MKQINTTKTFLGSFEMKDEELIVSDPCYERDAWCQTKIDKVSTGIWSAFVVAANTSGGWGNRVWELIALKSDNLMPTFKEKSESIISVDSGMAGIFSESFYLGGDRDSDSGSSWYENCCDLTCEGSCAGLIEGGVVSSTGFGDGGYECFIDRNNDGKVIGVKIVFISKQEEWEV